MSEKVEKATLVSDYIQSGFPILSVCSREPDRTEDRIVSEIDSLVEFMRGRLRKTDPAAAARYTFTVYAWDCRRGRRDLSGNGAGNDPDMMDPFSLLQWFSSEECGERNVLLIHNFHRQIGEDLGIIQHLQNIVPILKTSLRTIIFVSPDMDVPVELERIVTEIDFPLPTAEEIKEEFIKMADEYKQDINEADLDEAVEVAKGLTMFEAENAVSLSIIRSMGIDKETIFEVKSQMIKKNGDLEISSFDETLDSLKGYQNLKEFGLEVLSHPLSRGILLLGVSGCGKCLVKDTPVLCYDGSVVPVQEVKEGDILMGPDSLPRCVSGVVSGRGNLYKVTPKKGEPYTVNDAHVLSLKRSGSHNILNIGVTDYVNMCKDTPAKAEQLKGWRCGVDWPHISVPVPAYVLGAWLGDGDSRNPHITIGDPEIANEFSSYASQNGMFLQKDTYEDRGADRYRVVGKIGAGGKDVKGSNKFLNFIREFDLVKNKHIPKCYLINDKVTRLEMLAGLIDADGYHHGGCYEIITKYSKLRDGILFIARSLGFAAYSKEKESHCQTGGGGVYHRISISGDISQIPVRVPRKKASLRKMNKDVCKVGINVEPVGVGSYYGFEVDKDHLFLLGDFTVTHNSHYAKAIGKAIGMPTVSLSFGNMFDSLVGSSERKIKQALQICDAMSPLLLFIDELEKDLAGAQSSGETDSGVTKRVMKTFLTWLSDHKSRVPIIATANSVKYVPPEFLRAERWDAIFFVNVPTEEESEAILQHYLTVYDIKASVEEVRAKINMRNWTGAEIETLCRLGHIMGGDIEKSSKYVVPIYSAKKAEIDELRAEALQYAIPASGALDNAVKSVREPSPATRQLIQGSSGGKSTVKLSKKKKTDGSVN